MLADVHSFFGTHAGALEPHNCGSLRGSWVLIPVCFTKRFLGPHPSLFHQDALGLKFSAVLVISQDFLSHKRPPAPESGVLGFKPSSMLSSGSRIEAGT